MLTKLLRGLLFPTVFGGSLAVFHFLQAAGAQPGAALFAMTIGNLVVVAALEAAFPYRKEWAWWRDGQAVNDLLHGALLTAVGPRIGEAAFSSFIVASIAALAPLGGMWPSAWPLAAQILIAVFVTDFFDAAKHWVYHNLAPAWPIHALHHSPDRLHVTKGARLHFLESSIRYGIITAPLLIAGAGPDVIFWYAAVMNALGNLNHSNIDMPLPRVLHYLFATPQVHRLHHSVDAELGRSNLSPGFMFPDHLFGTFRDPARFRLEGVGIENNPVPRGILAQILTPVIWPTLIRRRRRQPSNNA